MTDILGGEEAAGVDLGGLGAEPTGTDALPADALAGATGTDLGDLDAEQLEVEELEAALADPETPPEERAMIQARLATAARRRLAGIGDAGGLV